MSFNLTDTVSCDRCGRSKASSDARCKCSEYETREYEFYNYSTGETVYIETVPHREWQMLSKEVDDCLPFICKTTGKTSLHMKQEGMDVTEL